MEGSPEMVVVGRTDRYKVGRENGHGVQKEFALLHLLSDTLFSDAAYWARKLHNVSNGCFLLERSGKNSSCPHGTVLHFCKDKLKLIQKRVFMTIARTNYLL